ncbi:MAG: ATP-binding cassette domain-containing protein [Caldilineaceae bacterium]
MSEIIRQDREQLNVPGFVAPTKLRGEITYDNVSFAYRGSDAPVLRNISFHATAGQRIALLGATGSGKTSLVNLLPVYEYTDGRILLDGKELTTHSAGYLRQHIGIVRAGAVPLLAHHPRQHHLWGGAAGVAGRDRGGRRAVHDVIRPSSPKGTTPWWANGA